MLKRNRNIRWSCKEKLEGEGEGFERDVLKNKKEKKKRI